MCGIAGIYAYKQSAQSVNKDELEKIRDHMAARGPDGKGEWYSSHLRVGLAHRRLAIIDLSGSASQPMASEDGQLVISFNGEIYNYQALRKQLEQNGYKFRTHSDTEVLLQMYAWKGEAMLPELRGMFAFAIWDDRKQSMWLARDPYGIKPLYYVDDGKTFRLASQVKALLQSTEISKEPDAAGIVGFYLLGSIPEPYTSYRNIKSIPAGSSITVAEKGVSEPKQYFSIASIWSKANESIENQEIVIREALLDSVKHHMVADVPVGAFLSSGIDSGALVGLMCEQSTYNQRPKTMTLSFNEFKDTQSDESPLAEQVAKLYGTDHTTRYVDEKEFHQDLPKIMDVMDQPSIDGLNTWFVSKLANEQGLKVAVSGLGGDELFGGYPSFRDIPNWVNKVSFPSRIPGMAKLFRHAYSSANKFRHAPAKGAGMLEYGGSYPGAWFLRRGLFMPWELPSFIDPDLVATGLNKLNVIEHVSSTIKAGSLSNFGKIASMEASLYMRNQLLRDSDWASMAHSLEIRLPLVDHQLLKDVAPIINTYPDNGKRALAMSPASPLPEKVINRPKTGFTTPLEKWLKSTERYQQVSASDKSLKHQHWSRTWARIVGPQV